jgi:hypothetical protein
VGAGSERRQFAAGRVSKLEQLDVIGDFRLCRYDQLELSYVGFVCHRQAGFLREET